MADVPEVSQGVEVAIRAGRLREALAGLETIVRRAPGRLELRVRLLQVLFLLGEWERARTQLQILPELGASDGELDLAASAFNALLDAELERQEVFAGTRTPLIFGEPSDWMARQAEAVRLFAGSQFGAAKALVEQVREDAPAVSGSLDGEPFAWIADADPRIGPVFEVYIEKRYFWIPFGRLRQVEVQPSGNLQDRVWIAAGMRLETGAVLQGYLPVRYPGSEREADGAVQSAAVSNWLEVGEQMSLGLGQRLLITDQTEKPVLRVRCLVLDAGP